MQLGGRRCSCGGAATGGKRAFFGRGVRVTVTLAAFSIIGCGDGGDRTAPLNTNEILRSRSSLDARRINQTDRGGALEYDELTAGSSTPLDDPAARRSAGSGNNMTRGVSDTVRQGVVSPRDEAARHAGLSKPDNSASATGSTTRASLAPSTGVGVGATWTLGAVVVEVDGEPIYAHRVIQTLEPVLAANAREMDVARFRAAALREIEKQVRVLVRDQIQYATARRNLDANERRMADWLTQRWRDNQIRRAGGSLEVARQASAAQGIDFDTALDEQYRLSMRQVYFQRKEMPKIQVTADDMRQYYQQHLKDKFTQREQAQFRVIKVGFTEAGGRDKARARAEEARAKAVEPGADFAKLAAEYNTDPRLARNSGDPTGDGSFFDRGAFANQKLEAAIWGVEPGQVTPLVESNDAWYLAKVLQVKSARVLPFETEEVQGSVRKALEAEQFTALEERVTQQLLKNAIVFPDPPRLDAALEIAMQRYPYWAARQ